MQFIFNNNRFLKASVFVLCIFFLFDVCAQTKVPFAQRTSELVDSPFKGNKVYHLQGDFVMLGNANNYLAKYRDSGKNDWSAMEFSLLQEDNGKGIKNSSSADFVLPQGISEDCTKIVYAGLYWSGRADDKSGIILGNIKNKGHGLNKKSVKFKGPKQSDYEELVSQSEIFFEQGASVSGMYAGYYDVTNFVKEQGVGTYSVGDIATLEGVGGGTGYYGGWGMVIVFENPTLKWRDITIFDGFSYVGSRSKGQIDLKGINTIDVGQVNVTIGMMAGEGDRFATGDYFEIRKGMTNKWLRLSHTNNATENFFNSSIFVGNTPREPERLNNFGIDIVKFDIPNSNNEIINLSQDETSFRFGTSSDVFCIYNIVFAVDAFVSEVDLLNSNTNNIKEGDLLQAGDGLDFELSINNKSTEQIINSKVEIPIPFNVHFVSADIEQGNGVVYWKHPSIPDADPSKVAGGVIIWDLGDLDQSTEEIKLKPKLKYKVKATDRCELLALSSFGCLSEIAINGAFTGKGFFSNAQIQSDFIKEYEANDFCAPNQPIKGDFKVGLAVNPYDLKMCLGKQEIHFEEDLLIFNFSGCEIQKEWIIERLVVTPYFPIGTEFYSVEPINRGFETSLITNDFKFDNVLNESIFYAIIDKKHRTCYVSFKIKIVPSIRTILLSSDELCKEQEGLIKLSGLSQGESVTWEYYTIESNSWNPIVTSTWASYFKTEYSSLKIPNTKELLQGLEIRCKVKTKVGCEILSEQLKIEISECEFHVNPSLRARVSE